MSRTATVEPTELSVQVTCAPGPAVAETATFPGASGTETMAKEAVSAAARLGLETAWIMTEPAVSTLHPAKVANLSRNWHATRRNLLTTRDHECTPLIALLIVFTGILRPCQGRGREFESRFPLQM